MLRTDLIPAHHFCKLFFDENGRQILVKHDQSDDGRLEVRIYYTPRDDFGVCSIARTWHDDDRGEVGSRSAFERMDEAEARRYAAAIDAEIAELAKR